MSVTTTFFSIFTLDNEYIKPLMKELEPRNPFLWVKNQTSKQGYFPCYCLLSVLLNMSEFCNEQSYHFKFYLLVAFYITVTDTFGLPSGIRATRSDSLCLCLNKTINYGWDERKCFYSFTENGRVATPELIYICSWPHWETQMIIQKASHQFHQELLIYFPYCYICFYSLAIVSHSSKSWSFTVAFSEYYNLKCMQSATSLSINFVHAAQGMWSRLHFPAFAYRIFVTLLFSEDSFLPFQGRNLLHPLTKILDVNTDDSLLPCVSVYWKFLRKDIKFGGLLGHWYLLGSF